MTILGEKGWFGVEVMLLPNRAAVQDQLKVLNSARIRTREEQLSGQALIRYNVNVASHEVGHASRTLPEYDNDTVPSFGLIPFRTGEPGTVMGKEDQVTVLAADIREFSSRDAARIADFVNTLDGDP